jgi:hypothetical protein
MELVILSTGLEWFPSSLHRLVSGFNVRCSHANLDQIYGVVTASLFEQSKIKF